MKNLQNVTTAVCICLVVTLLLAFTNAVTAPIIETNQNNAANEALLEVMPNGKSFEIMDLSAYTLPATVTDVYKETSGLGYVIRLTTAGYGSDMKLMCGVSTDGVILGAVCLSSNETLGYEKEYGENFTDNNAAGVEAVDTVSGATKSTEAYKNDMIDALNTASILGGNVVDIRTEEEILADNLCAALPAGEGAFTKVFITEVITGVDAMYQADNGAGFVCVTGEQFIGTDADGNILTDGAENAGAVTDAVIAITSSVTEDIDLTAYPDLAATVVSAKKTATGHFILETKGAGYGIKGGNEYHPASGEYIVVRVAIGADGQILDCLTVSEGETDGLGDACADENFYGQFDGKNEDTYTDIDGISGATLTTDGYKQAVARAYEAMHILKNGGDDVA